MDRLADLVALHILPGLREMRGRQKAMIILQTVMVVILLLGLGVAITGVILIGAE